MSDPNNWMHIVYAVLLLLLIAPAAWHMNKQNFLRNMAVWLVIILLLVLGYQHFMEPDQPSHPAPSATQSDPVPPDQAIDL